MPDGDGPCRVSRSMMFGDIGDPRPKRPDDRCFVPPASAASGARQFRTAGYWETSGFHSIQPAIIADPAVKRQWTFFVARKNPRNPRAELRVILTIRPGRNQYPNCRHATFLTRGIP